MSFDVSVTSELLSLKRNACEYFFTNYFTFSEMQSLVMRDSDTWVFFLYAPKTHEKFLLERERERKQTDRQKETDRHREREREREREKE